MRILFVGDPHAEPNDLADCRALAKLVLDLAEQRRVDLVVLAGDLYNTHAVIHAEVQYFWWEFFEEIRARDLAALALKGNHDAPGDLASKATALVAHVEQCVTVLHRPYLGETGLVFCPYTTGEQLVRWSAQAAGRPTLFCHQTFDGSVYENGFYAGDGVDPNLIKQKQIISGHIHTPQEFGKVWYPGAPRWRTLADANVDRAVWVLEFADGHLVNRTPYDTGTVCRRIVSVEDTPDRPLCLRPDPKDDYRVSLRGPRDWIHGRLGIYDGWAKVQALPTDARAEAVVKESDGVVAAFSKWLEAFVPAHGTDKGVLKKMAGDRLGF